MVPVSCFHLLLRTILAGLLLPFSTYVYNVRVVAIATAATLFSEMKGDRLACFLLSQQIINITFILILIRH